jgi:hypothetical protein
MKRSNLLIFAAIVSLAIAVSLFHLRAAESQSQPNHQHRYEYATIRWGGRENTHIVRPNGEVEFVAAQLDKISKPNRVDDRAFYMNIVMNGLAKEGYEFAGISNDDIVMKRAVDQ